MEKMTHPIKPCNGHLKHGLLADGAVVLFYILAACLFTYPMVFGLADAYLPPGYLEGNDLTHFYWTFWWVKESLASLHANPYFTDYIFYPSGTTLVFHTVSLLNSVASIPLQHVFGVVRAYNILYMVSLVIAAYGGYRLVCYLTGSRLAALAAGTIFSFNPHHWDKYGQINLANYGFIAFFCLYYIKMHREDRWAHVLPAAFFMALAAYSEWTLGVFIVLFVFIYMCWLAITGGYATTSAMLKKTSVVFALFLIAVSPVAYMMVKVMLSGTGFSYVASSGLLDVQDIFGFAYPKGGRMYYYNWGVLFGYTACALAFLSVLQIRRREVLLWLIVFGFFFLASLGPHWVWRGKTYEDIPLLFSLLSKIPIINGVRHPFRYWTMDMLALSVLAGYTLAWLRARLERAGRGRAFAALAALISIAVLMEGSVVPRVAWSSEVPWYYRAISMEPGDFAVLEVPFMGWTEGSYMYYQTAHGKRLLGGYISRIPPSAFGFARANRLTGFLMGMKGSGGMAGAEAVTAKDVKALKDAGVRYVLMHKHMLYNDTPDTYKDQGVLDRLIPLPLNRSYRGLMKRENREAYYTKRKITGRCVRANILNSSAELDAFQKKMDAWFGPPLFVDAEIVVYRL